jgi:hypothetical protein
LLWLIQLEKLVRKKNLFFEKKLIFFIDHGLHQVRRQSTPVLPSSIDFDIPSRYKKTSDGQRYLLSDKTQSINGNVEKRIIVYATDEQLRLLFTSSHIMMDGTFDSCPPHFDQLYSIHAIKNNQSKLLLFCLKITSI